MPFSVDAEVRQTVFVLFDSLAKYVSNLPSDWQLERVASLDQVLTPVRVAAAAKKRLLLVVSEADFVPVCQAIRQQASETFTRGGFLVISKQPEKFIRDHASYEEWLDAVSEKDWKSHADVALVCAVRILAKLGEGGTRNAYRAMERLNEVFIALSAERNPQRLLATCLVKSMDLTRAEGGTLYLVQERDGKMFFRLKITNDRSDEVTFQYTTIKVLENSICGYVALTGKALNLQDVGSLRPLTLPQLHRTLDHSHSLEAGALSMLTVPFKNSRNEVVAVLQLINKHGEAGMTHAFDSEDESLLASFATQAAICMENVDLYSDIQRLFEGFVKASISAIESRDPSTGGHSERVARMSVALARATTECEVGIYRSVRFREEEIRELEYAALLHDFGKIGVREEILVKAKKLYPYQLEAIKERLKTCRAAAKILYLERLLKGTMPQIQAEREYHERLRQLDSYWEIINAANEPTVLKRENQEILERIRAEQLLLPDNTYVALVTEEEFRALSVMRGSLTDVERLEIESHVRHTYQFLKMIPWTKDFRHLAEIAYAHHEKLDGTGYPRGLTAHEIPLQSKIMTIADIYDALTAADRWYKEAVPVDKALDILREEVQQGKLDPVLFEIFIEKKIYELIQPKILSRVA